MIMATVCQKTLRQHKISERTTGKDKCFGSGSAAPVWTGYNLISGSGTRRAKNDPQKKIK